MTFQPEDTLPSMGGSRDLFPAGRDRNTGKSSSVGENFSG
jgi:hypothetical protein